jgi:hypothetical protein
MLLAYFLTAAGIEAEDNNNIMPALAAGEFNLLFEKRRSTHI